MKQYILFDLIFDDEVGSSSHDDFIDNIYGLVEDSLEFQCDFYNPFSIDSFEFDKDGTVDIMLEITDAEDNGGTAVCNFDHMGLKFVLIDFMYEDGNQYQEEVYRRK